MNEKKEYRSIKKMVEQVKEKFGEKHKIAVMFENCISNTLETTVRYDRDGSVFVITGDIPAMWLRDSSCQLRPFLLFAREEPEICEMIIGLIRRQIRCILIDPYANAFNETANCNGHQDDRTQMRPDIWERKFEIDSLCFPFQLSYQLWKNTGCTDQFDENWVRAARTVIDLFRTEQHHEEQSPYFFERFNCVYTDTLSRNGKGALVKSGIGLIWSGFRPSDDACTYGYLIPSNMLACVALKEIAEIAGEVYQDHELSGEASVFSEQVRNAIETYAIVPGYDKDFYAYEVDGFGQYQIMDDANIPSLLAMPYIGYCSKEYERYQNTRDVILSEWNPCFYKGKALQGIGSPHTKPGWVWPMAMCVQGMTCKDPEEKYRILEMVCENDDGTNLIHESVFTEDPSLYTRPWFSWANSVFCEFVMDYMGYSVKM